MRFRTLGLLVVMSGGRRARPADRRSTGGVSHVVVAVFLLAQVAAGGAYAADPLRDPIVYHDFDAAPGMTLYPTARYGISVMPGTVVMGGLAGLVARSRVTIVGIRPWRLDPGVELLTTRGTFHAVGGHRTPFGYHTSSGSMGSGCRYPWGVTGYGPSYPVEGLELAPGDPLAIVFYVRNTRTGLLRAHGFEVEYRTGDGRTHVASGSVGTLEMQVYDETDVPDGYLCRPDRENSFTEPANGFPG